MAVMIAPCGRKMTMTEFARHVPKCVRCSMWWIRKKGAEMGKNIGTRKIG